ncbi:MAG: sigma-70 factor domain-containing protein, partial [Vulcanococcus sp.]
MAKGPPRPPANSGKKRGSSDLVRLYLQDIGRVDLLSHEEELTLARQVQRRERLLRERRRLAATHPALQELINLEEDQQRLASQLGHWPAVQQWAEQQQCTVAERIREKQQAWAEHSNLSVAELKQALHHGRRSRDRMIQANLRLVVAVAKKYQQRGMELLDLVQEGTLGLERA